MAKRNTHFQVGRVQVCRRGLGGYGPEDGAHLSALGRA
jgi:hypothetical protein